jgi:hypothetical protein
LLRACKSLGSPRSVVPNRPQRRLECGLRNSMRSYLRGAGFRFAADGRYCARLAACAFAPKLATPMLMNPDHMIGAASKDPKCQPSSIRKVGGGPSVSPPNPTAIDQRQTSRVFEARSGSLGCIRREAVRIRAAVSSTEWFLVKASPIAIERYIHRKVDAVGIAVVSASGDCGCSNFDCA